MKIKPIFKIHTILHYMLKDLNYTEFEQKNLEIIIFDPQRK